MGRHIFFFPCMITIHHALCHSTALSYMLFYKQKKERRARKAVGSLNKDQHSFNHNISVLYLDLILSLQ